MSDVAEEDDAHYFFTKNLLAKIWAMVIQFDRPAIVHLHESGPGKMCMANVFTSDYLAKLPRPAWIYDHFKSYNYCILKHNKSWNLTFVEKDS